MLSGGVSNLPVRRLGSFNQSGLLSSIGRFGGIGCRLWTGCGQWELGGTVARVILAMSGGVDSSVAAKLLLQGGHDVIGVFMRHSVEANACATNQEAMLPVISTESDRIGHKQGCCTARDAEDARQVADRLAIPFYALDLSSDFGRIIDYFMDEYSIGRTPNPCIMCNNWIKFGRLFDYADSVEAEFVATGHYARLETKSGQWSLCRGIDDSKDQSYVLFGIDPSYLSRMILPLGVHRKSEIRALATEIGLRVADKKDSQEICFVNSGKHAEFIAERRGELAHGNIVTTAGRVVGSHQGIEGFTIGQRRGLKVAMGEPYFVVEIRAEENEVVIGPRNALECHGLTARRTNWLAPPPTTPRRCSVQIRYNSRPVESIVTFNENEDSLEVEFSVPCHGVAPGQAAVCYDGDQVLGGGWIESTSRAPKSSV